MSSPRIPPAVGPYSQAIRSGNLLFCSGIVPLDPATGKMVEGGIREQVTRVLDNIKLLLEDCGASLGDVVKTSVFMANLGDFAEMNAVYATYFPQDPPARSTFQVGALPLGAQVEIEVIAALD
ncbi:MAG: RidA family protein [Armatimonadetes bacterium]|nr:RidA family protein [Armatimonadota bacterium]MDI9582740.1 RidA family protein [Acidobacteriota bacterium]